VVAAGAGAASVAEEPHQYLLRPMSAQLRLTIKKRDDVQVFV
jgi:hypothetical protein